jgi:hypothetical protein
MAGSVGHIRRVTFVSAAVGLLLLAGCSSDGGRAQGRRATSTSAPPATSAPSAASTTSTVPAGTADLAAILQRAVTEERHAEATYANVVDALGPVKPFTNIVDSERSHVAALVQVAEARGVDVSGATSSGEVSPSTKTAACRLGVDAEIADVALYDELLPQVSGYPDVVRVFTNLRAASQDSHLPAFQRCA